MSVCRFAAVVIVISIGTATAQNISREFPNGLVSDRKMAIAIAEAVLFHVYGEKTIREQRPYIVKHVRDNGSLMARLHREAWRAGVFTL